MDAKRQGEIAVVLFRLHLRKKGVKLSRSKMREFGNMAKATGVTVEELKEFFRPFVQEVVDDCLGK